MLSMLNKLESDILLYLKDKVFVSQRDLSSILGCSLGAINQSIKTLKDKQYLDESLNLTLKASDEIVSKSPKTS